MNKKLLEKIKSKGYWKVIIRPTEHKDDLINSRSDLKELIRKNKISLRGWSYPYIDQNKIKYTALNSISCDCDWPEGPKFEHWRFYKTGQFIHYFAMREDIRINPEEIKELQIKYGVKTDKFLSIISTLCSVTEIFKFASRLFFEVEEVGGVELIIELHDVKDRVLFFRGGNRLLFETLRCEYDKGVIDEISKVIKKEELINKSEELALDFFGEILEAFRWENFNKDIFREQQRKFLKGIL